MSMVETVNGKAITTAMTNAVSSEDSGDLTERFMRIPLLLLIRHTKQRRLVYPSLRYGFWQYCIEPGLLFPCDETGYPKIPPLAKDTLPRFNGKYLAQIILCTRTASSMAATVAAASATSITSVV